MELPIGLVLTATGGLLVISVSEVTLATLTIGSILAAVIGTLLFLWGIALVVFFFMRLWVDRW